MTTGNDANDWQAPKAVPQKLTPEEHGRWLETTKRVRELAQRENLSKAEVAKRADIKISTFSLWYDGTYTGLVNRFTRLVEQWLDSVDEALRYSGGTAEPGFVRTRVAAEIIERLAIAQALPSMGTIVVGAGMGKTFTANHYVASHRNVSLVTMSPETAGVRAALSHIAAVTGARTRGVLPSTAIGEKLRRDGRQTLLIVDEAQHLTDAAINQLRYFFDVYQCGLVLLGNERLAGRIGKDTTRDAQIHRRVFIRLYRPEPEQADIDAYIAAWRITDREAIEFARGLGKKPGALGQVAATLKLAHMMAAGNDEPVSIDYVREAWETRDEEANPRRANGGRR